MNNIDIFEKISDIDSLKQERIFLLHKYNDFVVDKSLLEGILEDSDINTLIDDKSGKIGKINIFDLFETLGKDENKIISILAKKYLQDNTFDVRGKKYSFQDLKKKGFKTKLKQIRTDLEQDSNLIIKDILSYFEIISRIERLEKEEVNIKGENVKVGTLRKYYSKVIMSELLRKRRGEDIKTEDDKDFEGDGRFDDIFNGFLGLEYEDFKENPEEIKNIAWKYNFFKIVQDSVKDGYVLSHREVGLIDDIVTDLKSGEVVLMTGNTGSGKTELARFICRKYLKTDYVFISSRKDLETSELTIEKQVTSRSKLNSRDKVISGDKQEESIDQKSIEGFKEILKSDEYKENVIALAKKNGKNEEYISKLKKDLDNINFSDKSLITEYHLMGLYKAAELGQPCIIDEVNIMRPEVFMSLNDLLTRREGDDIQLPNSLDDITVEKGFCIILTGNDPEQNTDSTNYTLGRYNFDAATYNRLRVYAKDYLSQVIETKNENRLDELDKTYEHLKDNELYGVVLMMMFQNKTDIIHSGKYGYEIMKRNFDGNHVNKSEFFKSMKNFSKAISTIQKSFDGKTIILDKASVASNSLKDMIKRKVFSMRNLIKVLDSYKNDVNSLDYHIYREFVQHTTDAKEKYALILVFNNFGFYKGLVTDNIDATINNVETKIESIKREKNKIKLEDIENKKVITKQDLYREYFGSFELENSYFEDLEEQDFNDLGEKDYENDSENNQNFSNNEEITGENLLEFTGVLQDKLSEKESYIEINSFMEFTNLFILLESTLNEDKISENKYNFLNNLLVKLNLIFEDLGNSDIDYGEELEQVKLEQVKLELSNLTK